MYLIRFSYLFAIRNCDGLQMTMTILNHFLNSYKYFCDARFHIIQRTMICCQINNVCATLRYATKFRLDKAIILQSHYFTCIFSPLSAPLCPHQQILALLFHNANQILNLAIGYLYKFRSFYHTHVSNYSWANFYIQFSSKNIYSILSSRILMLAYRICPSRNRQLPFLLKKVLLWRVMPNKRRCMSRRLTFVAYF